MKITQKLFDEDEIWTKYLAEVKHHNFEVQIVDPEEFESCLEDGPCGCEHNSDMNLNGYIIIKRYGNHVITIMTLGEFQAFAIATRY